MDEKKIIYEIIISIWELAKECGFQQLTDEQWELLIDKANRERSKILQYGTDADLLFRGMFKELQNYYERKKQ